MKIAVVHSRYKEQLPSGENVVVDLQVEALRRAGHEVKVFFRTTPTSATSIGFKIAAGVRVATGVGTNPLSDIEKFNPNVIHVHNLFPNFSSSWLRHSAFPIVVSIHNFRAICASGTFFRDGKPCYLCLEGKSSIPALKHACYQNSVVATLPLVWANRKQGANGSVVSAAKKILVLNAESKKLFAEAGWPNQKMEVLPNFIPDNLADYSARVSSRQGKSSWIYAGRFSEEKGILELLEDWPASQKLRLAGDGPQLKQVLELAKSNTAIEYLGKISREQVIAEIARSKGLIFPSIWMEGLALTCIEATSVGCPIIARRGNAAASAVLAHNLGAVYDKGIDLGDALAQVEQRSSYFGNSAREYYERTFSEPAWTSNILRVYKDATNE